MHCFRCQTVAKGSLRPLAAILLCALALTACGDKTGDKKPASQVAAKVNSNEISIHQVNFLLQHTPGVTPEKADLAKRQILNDLVDQELAVQQALDAKLDRDPKVMQSLEASRREILAKAYLEKVVAGKNKPSTEEVRSYYREHPELFANRKIYRLQEIGFSPNPETVAAVREQIAKAKSGEDLLNSLRARGIQAAGAVLVKPSEKISLDILPRLAQMKDGQSALFETGEQASIITVLGTAAQPLGEDAARPFIEQFLSRRQNTELARETIEDLRKKAKIEYVGEFGKEAEAERQARLADEARKADEAKAAREAARLAQAADAAKQAETQRKLRSEAEAARDQSKGTNRPAPSDNAISKGLSALK